MRVVFHPLYSKIYSVLWVFRLPFCLLTFYREISSEINSSPRSQYDDVQWRPWFAATLPKQRGALLSRTCPVLYNPTTWAQFRTGTNRPPTQNLRSQSIHEKIDRKWPILRLFRQIIRASCCGCRTELVSVN